MTNAQTEERAIAPERIWIEQDNCPYFYHEDELSEVGSPVTGYVREDIFAAKDAELAAISVQFAEARKALVALDRMSRGVDWCDQDEQARRWSAARCVLEGGKIDE